MGASMPRPQVFGAGVSLGMVAGVVLGSLVTMWLGEAAADFAHRIIDKLSGRNSRLQFDLFEQ